MISIEFIAAINMGISHYRISLYLNFLSRTLPRILSWRKVLPFSLARGHTNYRAVRACDLVDRKTPRVFEKVNLERVEGRCVYIHPRVARELHERHENKLLSPANFRAKSARG